MRSEYPLMSMPIALAFCAARTMPSAAPIIAPFPSRDLKSAFAAAFQLEAASATLRAVTMSFSATMFFRDSPTTSVSSPTMLTCMSPAYNNVMLSK